jgi:hypothetical protein
MRLDSNLLQGHRSPDSGIRSDLAQARPVGHESRGLQPLYLRTSCQWRRAYLHHGALAAGFHHPNGAGGNGYAFRRYLQQTSEK